MKNNNVFVQILLILTIIISVGCDKDPTSSRKPEVFIRLKAENDLPDSTIIDFIALSKSENYRELESPSQYDKTKADWYIDGGIAPFTTEYKECTLAPGKYSYLQRCSYLPLGTIHCSMGEETIREGKQTIVLYDNSTYIDSVLFSLWVVSRMEYP